MMVVIIPIMVLIIPVVLVMPLVVVPVMVVIPMLTVPLLIVLTLPLRLIWPLPGFTGVCTIPLVDKGDQRTGGGHAQRCW